MDRYAFDPPGNARSSPAALTSRHANPCQAYDPLAASVDALGIPFPLITGSEGTGPAQEEGAEAGVGGMGDAPGGAGEGLGEVGRRSRLALPLPLPLPLPLSLPIPPVPPLPLPLPALAVNLSIQVPPLPTLPLPDLLPLAVPPLSLSLKPPIPLPLPANGYVTNVTGAALEVPPWMMETWVHTNPGTPTPFSRPFPPIYIYTCTTYHLPQVGSKASGAIAAMGSGISSGISSGVGSVSSTLSYATASATATATAATAATMDAVQMGWQAQAQVGPPGRTLLCVYPGTPTPPFTHAGRSAWICAPLRPPGAPTHSPSPLALPLHSHCHCHCHCRYHSRSHSHSHSHSHTHSYH